MQILILWRSCLRVWKNFRSVKCCSSPVPSKMIEKPYGISLLPLTHGFIVCHKTSFPMTITQTEKALKFQKLHQQQGAFLIPNPWDAGSARILAGLGFE